MRVFIARSLMFFRALVFLTLVGFGFCFSTIMIDKYIASPGQSAGMMFLCSFLCAIVFLLTMKIAILVAQFGSAGDCNSSCGQADISMGDGLIGLALYSLSSIVIPVITASLSLFFVMSVISSCPVYWWMILPALLILFNVGWGFSKLRVLERLSEPASEIRLSDRLRTRLIRSGLKNWSVRLRDYPWMLKEVSGGLNVAGEKPDYSLKYSLVKPICAYSFMGKNVVLMCPLTLEILSEDELDSIVAHEMGHLVLAHSKILALLSCIASLVASSMAFYLVTSLPQFYLLDGGRLDLVATLFTYIYMVTLATLVLRSIARLFELRADQFALSVCRSPETYQFALIKVYDLRKSDRNVTAGIFDSHPSFVDRMKLADSFYAGDAT